jgi:solute carrier family 41
MLVPVLSSVAWRCEATRCVLVSGWGPVLTAAAISSAGGHVLRATVARFPAAAAYQPVMNGAAGNLVAVHASRMATDLHTHGMPSDIVNDLRG